MNRFGVAIGRDGEVPLKEILGSSRVLPRSFYERPTVEVARDLLGKILVHGRTAGRIVEVEAYLGEQDRAAHAWHGLTPRTRVLYGPPGHAYVYFIYGMYECLNLVAEPEGTPGCVLIRALEPVSGLDLMRRRRPGVRSLPELASGPGKLTQALGITRRLNGVDVTRGPLTVRALENRADFQIGVSPRIGIRHCTDWPLRFYIEGNPCVSSGGRQRVRSGSLR
jgi:DNA-3-methyladenine glycosylase